MLHSIRSLPGNRILTGAVLLSTFLAVAACNRTDYAEQGITGTVPLDYRDRHPIRFAENKNEIQLLIGTGTGVLTADQRAQVAYLASTWRREGTGHLLIETPRGTANQRAAAYAAREAQSILRASGVPQRAIVAKSYQTLPDALGPVRLAYARVEAEAGPCGNWPEDLGAAPFPSLQRMPPQFDNRPYWNLGCSTQQNLAAMVANPEDLIQPRASTPAYAARRQTVIDKYRKGENPSGQYETDEAQASEVSQ
jgi:pilus assembly protein CpaD